MGLIIILEGTMKKVELTGTSLLIIVVGTVCITFVGILAIISGSLRSNPAYRMGVELAKTDPAVIELFGSPVREGFFVTGQIKGYLYAGHTANLQTSISGPKAHGTLFIYGTENEDGAWQILDMDIRIGRKPVLTYDTSGQGKGFQPYHRIP